jgi:hypothetical protein
VRNFQTREAAESEVLFETEGKGILSEKECGATETEVETDNAGGRENVRGGERSD